MIIEYAICYRSCLVMACAKICNDVIARCLITLDISTRYGLLLKICGMRPWCLYLAVRVPRMASSLKNTRQEYIVMIQMMICFTCSVNDYYFNIFWHLGFFSPYDYCNVVTNKPSLVQSLHVNFFSCIEFCNLLLTKIDPKLGFELTIDTPMLHIIKSCVTWCPL